MFLSEIQQKYLDEYCFFFAGKLNGDFWQFECHWRRVKHTWESLNCLCRKPSFLDNSGFGHCSKLPRPKDNICHYNKCFRVGNMNLDNLPNYPDMISKFLVHQKSKSKREFITGVFHEILKWCTDSKTI